MQMKNESGFTLVELLVVVLIVGILAAVALPQYSTAVEKSRSTEALSLMNAVAESAKRYCFQKDLWPNSFSQLDVEIPAYSNGGNGGKNFTITIEGGSTDCTNPNNAFTINATRRDLTGDNGYKLKTTLKTNSNTDNIDATRSCVPNVSGKKGETYCDAITNGHNSSF